ncbi:MAG: UDPGP type 1 family protein, partial [Spirochaetes bacterium]|nr:UDPGP type 1 family protein [Spirochaetota bacterium]
YSDLSTACTKDGKSPGAAFDTGSIAVHMINVDFAEQETSGANSLPLHIAHKAVPFIDSGGKKVEPEGSNGYKIETFIFDALMDSAESVIMEVRREDEFSPLKNKTGNDSPESVMRDQLLFFSGWFEEAGFSIPRASDGLPRYKLEVSPLFAVSKGDFIQKINRDIKVDRDMYIE